MEVNFSERNGHLIVAPAGEIDHHSSLGLRRSIERQFARSSCRNIIFDFSDVLFMDSSGIGVLIGRYRELKKTGGKVYVINISAELKRIFGLSGLSRIIPVHKSLEDVFTKGARKNG